MMPKLIGGAFAFDLSLNGTEPPFLDRECVFYLNARSAMWSVISVLRPSTVWMPSYLCPSMLQSPALVKAAVKFFPVDRQLRVVRGRWLNEVKVDDLVVIIDYFGFPHDNWIAQDFKSRGALILEDAGQALLSSHVGTASDFVVYSPRKFVGVPDGGVLSFRGERSLTLKTTDATPPKVLLKMLAICLERRDYDKMCGRGERNWFQLFQQMEREMPVGNFAPSGLTLAQLHSGIDWEFVARRRRENYLALLEKLGDLALFKELPTEVVPLGFPIVTRNRDQVRKVMFERNIYPPVHWELGDAAPKEFVDSHFLSQKILTLVCDQRYGEDDMERTVSCVLENAIPLKI